jgi:hypothetical protein
MTRERHRQPQGAFRAIRAARTRRVLGAAATAGLLGLLGAAGAAAATTTESVCPPTSAGVARCQAEVVVNAATGSPVTPADNSIGTPSPRLGSPQWLQWAYDLQGPSALGPLAPDTVAVVDPYGYTTAEADLNTYRATYGLPPCTTANGCLRKVDQTGGVNYPAQPGDVANESWLTEDALDLDMVSAICPNCHILYVQANTAGDDDLAVAEQAAARLGANQITNSWSWTGDNSHNAAFSIPGVAVVAATGDSGYNTFGVPAELPFVTAAGGTTLPAANNARGFAEGAWSGTASGCYASGAKPSWQTDSGCHGRTVADLSADASGATGVLGYGYLVQHNVLVGPRTFSAGGTSVSSPIIAAYYALLGGGAGNGGGSWAYANAALLNDITSGSDGNCSGSPLYWCTAGSGYDGPTGEGSVSGDALPGAPQVGGSYSSAITDSLATLQGGAYANQNDTQAYWQYGPTTSYGQSTSPVDIGSGTGATPVSTPLSGLTASTQYHYRLVATSCAGTSYGFDNTFSTGVATTTTTTTTTSTSTTDSTTTSTSTSVPTSATTASSSACAQYTTTTATTTDSSSSTSSPPVTSVTQQQPTTTVTATPLRQTTTTSTTTSRSTTTTHTTTAVAAFSVTLLGSGKRHGNRVQVRVRCNRRCAGAIELQVSNREIGDGRVALRKPGFTGVVTLTLNARGRRLVKSHRRLFTIARLALNGHAIRRNLLVL